MAESDASICLHEISIQGCAPNGILNTKESNTKNKIVETQELHDRKVSNSESCNPVIHSHHDTKRATQAILSEQEGSH